MAIIRKLLQGNLTELVQVELCSFIAPCPLGQNCPRKIAKSISMSLSRSMSRSRSRSRSKSMSMSRSESWSESRSRLQSGSIILTTTKDYINLENPTTTNTILSSIRRYRGVSEVVASKPLLGQ